MEKIINPYRAKILSLLYEELSLVADGSSEERQISKLIAENTSKIYEE